MIRIIYWLIKRRWSVCSECKHYQNNQFATPISNSGFSRDDITHQCDKYFWQCKRDFIKDQPGEIHLDFCIKHNKNGCCWGFEPKGGHIEPTEPWTRY
jgi:hypothetical protein